MSTLTIAEAREYLDELCASVAETGEPVRIESNGRNFMLIADTDSLAEQVTGDILSRPDDAHNLREAVARARSGAGIELTVTDLCNKLGLNEASI